MHEATGTRRRLRHLVGVRAMLASFAIAHAAFAGDPASGADANPTGTPAPASTLPMIVGAQYTFIDQHQTAIDSPYSGPLSLKPDGDTQPTNTFGLYGGWAPVSWGQLYLDLEKFDGAGVSDATGLAALTNGDVVREGAVGIKKEVYIARLFARFMVPLGDELVRVERAQDQIPGTEAATRIEIKIGRMAVNDDFDRNSYAANARGEFLNWSLWAETAWDYAADTRGYTNGILFGFISPSWALKYGFYLMPLKANGQELDYSLSRAHGQNLELRLSPWATGTTVRLLGYLNTARMGDYDEAVAEAAATGGAPNIIADDREGRHKYGFGLNVEQPLADDGDTGVFLRSGWDDGRTETFAFTETDRQTSVGAQVSGRHWRRGEDRFAIAFADQRLSAPHRRYLAAGGCGFLLCDGRLNYGHERILEAYYRFEYVWRGAPAPLHFQLSPDFQWISNPGYNRERGPARFWGIRFHAEY